MEVNLEGKVVVPGLIDSHVHFIAGGLQVITQTFPFLYIVDRFSHVDMNAHVYLLVEHRWHKLDFEG